MLQHPGPYPYLLGPYIIGGGGGPNIGPNIGRGPNPGPNPRGPNPRGPNPPWGPNILFKFTKKKIIKYKK